MDKLTKEELKQIVDVCFTPRSAVFIFMVFILIQFTDYMNGIPALILCVLIVQFFLGWINEVYYNMIMSKFQKLENKLDSIKEWMK